MGLVHSRASKRRDRAAASLLRAQAKTVRQRNSDTEIEQRVAHSQPVAALPWWRQPTIGAALTALAQRHRTV